MAAAEQYCGAGRGAYNRAGAGSPAQPSRAAAAAYRIRGSTQVDAGEDLAPSRRPGGAPTREM